MTANTSHTAPNRIRTHANHVGMQGGLIAGDSNQMLADYSIIGGGKQNFINTNFALTGNAAFSAITGGLRDTINYVYDTTNEDLSFIGGGTDNLVKNGAAVIVGGESNTIDTAADHSAIVGGRSNLLRASFGMLGGGESNLIDTGSLHAVLSGGGFNHIDTASPFASIGGGRGNDIAHNNTCATIPGGDSLIANSYAQTVVGYNNIKNTRAVTKAMALGGGNFDTALFIVGNGATHATPSDAFTVSYNGHSTAYQKLPTVAGTTTITGTTYADNTIIAWGDVSSLVGTFHGIGCTVTPAGFPGQYTITLNVNDPNGHPHVFTAADAAIVVTTDFTDPGGPAFAMAGPLVAGSPATFLVTTWDVGANAPKWNTRFQFHVVAH